MFVVQKHAARRLHYDFRLEMEGVLRSWAIPKGPSLDPAARRLAVMVEDHPLEYGDFEGVIQQGNYGAGSVIVWDRGTYAVIDPPGGEPAAAVRNGKLDIELRGFKLRGAFTLVRIRSRAAAKENWLLIKKRDRHATAGEVTASDPRSVLSGFTVEEIGAPARAGPRLVRELEALGAPRLTAALEPRAFPLSLAKLAARPFDGEGWLFEIKYDGVRMLAIRDGIRARLYARSRVEVTERWPEITHAIQAAPFERFVIDGEIVALGNDGRPDFQALQRRMHVTSPDAARRASLSIPVVAFVFDLLAFDGFDLRPLGCEARKRILRELAPGEGPIRYCDHVLGRGRDFWAVVSEMGLEGMVAKRREAPYHGTRSADWLKIKCTRRHRFVVGGYTDPAGVRANFGALLLGLYEADGALRFVGKVGTGFSADALEAIGERLRSRARVTSPYRKAHLGERPAPRRAHFIEPELVAEVRFADVTRDGCVRHPSFLRLVDDGAPRECTAESAFGGFGRTAKETEQRPMAPRAAAPAGDARIATAPVVTVSSPDKIFWPAEGYTKGDLVAYYRTISRWMVPYLKDRPVMIVRYPDGIEGKSFFQKDAPDFVPDWIRTERIYSQEAARALSYFIIESEAALAYVANLGAIPIHLWSSRLPHLESPDWLLFDLDPKGSTTAAAVRVARETVKLLGAIGLRARVKTSGQAGIHVMAGIRPVYTYEQARNFAEIVARLVVERMPSFATIERNLRARKGRVYIDYLQLGYAKTIAAPYAVRPLPGAPVSAPLRPGELRAGLDPAWFTIRTMEARMARMRRDPLATVLTDRQSLDRPLEMLAREYGVSGP